MARKPNMVFRALLFATADYHLGHLRVVQPHKKLIADGPRSYGEGGLLRDDANALVRESYGVFTVSSKCREQTESAAFSWGKGNVSSLPTRFTSCENAISLRVCLSCPGKLLPDFVGAPMGNGTPMPHVSPMLLLLRHQGNPHS